MSGIISCLKASGYSPDEEGVCFGYAMKAAEAYILGQFQKHRDRLKEIEQLPPKLSNIKISIDIHAFLQGVMLFQSPNNYLHLFDVNKPSPSQHNPELTAAIAQSELAEKQGGVREVVSFSGIYNGEEMEKYLSNYVMAMGAYKEIRCALLLVSYNHAIMLAYEVKSATWFIANHAEIYELTTISSVCKRIKEIFPANAGDDCILLSKVFSTGYSFEKAKSAIDTWRNSSDLKRLCAVTSEKAKTKGRGGETWLFLEARNGRLEIVKELLAYGADVNAVAAGGFVALHMAAQYGHRDILDELIKHGASLETTTAKGINVLHTALAAGQLKMVSKLLTQRVNVNAVTDKGITPLRYALAKGPAIVKELLAHGADGNVVTDEGATLLYHAAESGHVECVDVLLNHPDINSSSIDQAINGNLRVLLDIAESQGRLDEFKALQKDLIIQDGNVVNFSPLAAAAFFGHPKVVFSLIRAGAAVQNKTTQVFLQWNIKEVIKQFNSYFGSMLYDVNSFKRLLQDLKILEALLTWVSLNTSSDNTSLNLKKEETTPTNQRLDDLKKIINGCEQYLQNKLTAEKLLSVFDNKHLLSSIDIYGKTLLNWVIGKGHEPIAGLFLATIATGANVKVRTEDGQTLLHWAAKNGYTTIAIALIANGADINAVDNNGFSPLHSATANEHKDIINLLLQAGARVTVKDSRDQTPLQLAVYKQNKELAERFISFILFQDFTILKPNCFDGRQYEAASLKSLAFELSMFWEEVVELLELIKANNEITLGKQAILSTEEQEALVCHRKKALELAKSLGVDQFPIGVWRQLASLEEHEFEFLIENADNILKLTKDNEVGITIGQILAKLPNGSACPLVENVEDTLKQLRGTGARPRFEDLANLIENPRPRYIRKQLYAIQKNYRFKPEQLISLSNEEIQRLFEHYYIAYNAGKTYIWRLLDLMNKFEFKLKQLVGLSEEEILGLFNRRNVACNAGKSYVGQLLDLMNKFEFKLEQLVNLSDEEILGLYKQSDHEAVCSSSTVQVSQEKVVCQEQKNNVSNNFSFFSPLKDSVDAKKENGYDISKALSYSK